MAASEGEAQANQGPEVEGHRRGSGIEDRSLRESQARQSSEEGSPSMDADPEVLRRDFRPVSSSPLETPSLGQTSVAAGTSPVASQRLVELEADSPLNPESQALSTSAVSTQEQPLPLAPPMPPLSDATIDRPPPSTQLLPVESGASLGLGSAPARPSGPLLYHERQEMLLCGMHALNALLQVSVPCTRSA